MPGKKKHFISTPREARIQKGIENDSVWFFYIILWTFQGSVNTSISRGGGKAEGKLGGNDFPYSGRSLLRSWCLSTRANISEDFFTGSLRKRKVRRDRGIIGGLHVNATPRQRYRKRGRKGGKATRVSLQRKGGLGKNLNI